MKKLLATVMAGVGLGSALVAMPAGPAKAGAICPKHCILEGEVEGTGIFPPDALEALLPYTGIDLRNDVPEVSLGLVDIKVSFQPMQLTTPPPQAPATPQLMSIRKGTGTAVVIDDDAFTPDRTWELTALSSGTVTEGTVTLLAASPHPDLTSAEANAFSMRMGYSTIGAVTTFVGSFEEHYDGAAPATAAPLEEVVVSASDFDGTTTTSVLQAGATYKLTTSGVFDYDNIRPGQQHADAECTIDAPNPGLLERQSSEVPRWQPQRYFFVSEPPDNARQDFFDPDPSDDPVDLYVDGRDLAWVPNDPDVVNRAGCNEVDHTYVALFTPPTDRPLELRVFDLQYGDNGCSTVGCTTNSLTISIERVSDTPLRGVEGVRVDSTLVNSGDLDGQTTRPLFDGRTYAVEIRGMYKYQGAFPQAYYADAECARAGTSPAQNAVYRPHRFDGAGGITDPLDVYVDGVAVDWEPLGRTPTDAESADTAQCSPIHAYRTTVVGTGAPMHLLVKDTGDTKYGDNSGTLRVDFVELT